MEDDHDPPPMEVETIGRVVGEVKEPHVDPNVPELSDEELNQAASELGLTGLKIGQIKSLRMLGHAAREDGVISLGRGMLLASVGQLMEISSRASDLEKSADEHEIKVNYLRLRVHCANGIVTAARNAIESVEKKREIPQPPPQRPSLPEFGEPVALTQVNAQEVHIHKHA